VILITPYMAETNTPIALPTDSYQLSTDAEAIFLGQMEKNYGVGNDNFRGGYDGSVGFVLD
jgi:pilus assembly protein CpaC